MSASVATTSLETFLSMPEEPARMLMPILLSEKPLQFALDLIQHPSFSKDLKRDIPIFCIIKRVHLDKVVEMTQEINKSESPLSKRLNWEVIFRGATDHSDIGIVKDILKGSTITKKEHFKAIYKAAEYEKYDVLEELIQDSVSIRSSAIVEIFREARSTARLASSRAIIKSILATGPIPKEIRDLMIENTLLEISLTKRKIQFEEVDTAKIASLKELEKHYTEVKTTIEDAEIVDHRRLCLAIDAYRLFIREKNAKKIG